MTAPKPPRVFAVTYPPRCPRCSKRQNRCVSCRGIPVTTPVGGSK